MGDAGSRRRVHRPRGSRGDPERQHLLLAGSVRRRPPRDDRLQVPIVGGPGARHARRTPPHGPVVRPARRLAGDVHDRAHVHARRVLPLRPGGAAGERRLHGASSRSLGLRRDGAPLRRHVRRGGRDRLLRGRWVRPDRGGRAPRPDTRGRRAGILESWRPHPPGSGPRTSNRRGTRTNRASSRTRRWRCSARLARSPAPARANHAVFGAFETLGGGTVVNAGVTDWVYGLVGRDPDVERITRNILDRLAG